MKRSADRAATQKQGLLAIIGARKRRVLIIQRITLRHIAEEDIPSPHRSARCPYLASEAYNASSYFNLRCSPRAQRAAMQRKLRRSSSLPEVRRRRVANAEIVRYFGRRLDHARAVVMARVTSRLRRAIRRERPRFRRPADNCDR